ncbi:Helix-turn-helix domain protein [Caballeronia temeraria]|uniref:Helix-turn-helix domain protein n=1 Tax=Caballeronia temeraria TaxID=1777137 RepID=A0A158A548_9BURK|nr:helix-turn-helix domain-containing protein [Caballeronia temeraria]SAK52903.1 Helix-turn-helix domain protein [Caballeronia temeraria]
MIRTVTIGVSSLDEVMNRALKAVDSGKFPGHFFSYATPELLFRTFTTPRWQIIRAMTGAGPMSIRELSRRLERDVKGVHRDVKALLEAGLLEHDEHGAIVFPFHTVHVNFTLKAADLAPPAVAQRKSADTAIDEDCAQSPRSPRRRAAPRKREPRPAGNR